MIVIIFLLGLAAGIALGWRLKAASAAAESAQHPVDTLPPPAVIYEQGYAAGWRAAGSAATATDEPRTAVAPAVHVHPAASAAPAAPGAPAAPPALPHFRESNIRTPAMGPGRAQTTEPPSPRGNTIASPGPSKTVQSEAESAAKRARRDLRNINITLFTASLLLIGATALFIGSEFPAAVRFVGVVSVAALFYGSGLWIHGRIPRLQPAGLAFTGAGLAMIPFAGFALNVLVIHHIGWSWLVTAAMGGLAFVTAALRLRSRVVAYLSLPFMFSIAWAPANVLGAAMVWYFAITIAAAAVLTAVARSRPRWAGNLYLQIIREVHGYIVPGALLISLFAFLSLEPWDHVLISAAATLYYGVALGGSERSRIVVFNVYGLRVALLMSCMFAAAALGSHASTILYTGAGVVGLQAIVIAWLPAAPRSSFAHHLRLLGSTAKAAPANSGTGEPERSGHARGFEDWHATDAYWTFSVGLLTALVGLAVKDPTEVAVTGTLLVAVTGLLIAMVLAWRLRGGGEFLVPAALVLVLFMPGGELWCLEVVLALLLAYAVLRTLTSNTGSVTRKAYALVGRGLSVLGVGLLFLDYWPAGTPFGAGHVALLAMVAAIVVHQFVSFGQVMRGRSLWSAPLVLVACGVVAYVAVIALVVDFAPQGVTSAALWLTLFGLAVPATLLFRKVAWMEFVTPLAMVATAFFAIPVFSIHDYELLIVAVLGYVLILGKHSLDRAARTGYRLAGRGLTVATAAVFVLGHWEQSWPADAPSMALVVLAAGFFINQIVSLVQLRAGASPSAVGLAVTVFAAAMFGTAFGLVRVEGAVWADETALWLFLLGAAGSGVVLFGRLHWIQIPAGLAFPLTALMSIPVFDVVGYEILLGVGLVYGFTMAVRHPGRSIRGLYFLAGQIQLTLLTSIFLWDQKVSVHTFFTAFALSLLVQELLRTAFRRFTRDLGFQAASGWLTIAILVGIQPVYWAMAELDSQRGVTATALFALFATSLLMARWSRSVLRYIALACVPVSLLVFSEAAPFSDGGWLGGAELPHAPAAFLATAMGLLTLVLRHTTERVRQRRTTATLAAGVFLAEAFCFAVAAQGWAPAAVILVLAVVVFLESHTWNLPQLYALGSILVLAASWAAGSELVRAKDLDWAFAELQLAVHCAAAVPVYVWLVVARKRIRLGKTRRVSATLPVIAALTAGSLTAMVAGDAVIVASVVLVVTAVLGALGAPRNRRKLAAEGVFLVVLLAGERIWIRLDYGVELFWLMQVWAVGLTLISYFEQLMGRQRPARGWMIGAASILGMGGLLAVLTQDTGYQIWSLLGYAALLLHGMMRQSRLFTIWGAAGLSLAVLWFLRGYTFVLLAIVAAALIAFAVWRLNRSKDSLQP